MVEEKTGKGKVVNVVMSLDYIYIWLQKIQHW